MTKSFAHCSSGRNSSAMPLKWVALLFILSLLFVPAKGFTAPAWPLQVGQEYVYHVWDSTGFSGIDTRTVTGTTTIGPDVYFTFNYDDFCGDWCYRSTDTVVYERDEGRLIAWDLANLVANGPDLFIIQESVTVPYGGPFNAYALSYDSGLLPPPRPFRSWLG